MVSDADEFPQHSYSFLYVIPMNDFCGHPKGNCVAAGDHITYLDGGSTELAGERDERNRMDTFGASALELTHALFSSSVGLICRNHSNSMRASCRATSSLSKHFKP